MPDFGWGLPPGCTMAMIDAQCGIECPECDTPIDEHNNCPECGHHVPTADDIAQERADHQLDAEKDARLERELER